MTFLDRFDTASARLADMSRLLGAEMAGDGSPEAVMAYRGAVIRCAACRQGAACDSWRAQGTSAEAPPAFCRNRDRLRSLVRG